MTGKIIFKRILYITLSVMWMFVIYIFSSKTATDSTTESMFFTEFIAKLFFNNPSPEIISIIEVLIRKTAHLTEFAVLSILYCLTIKSFNNSGKTVLYSILFTLIYAITDELHQFFVPGRACRFYDILIDTTGGFIGYMIYYFFSNFYKRKK